MSGLLWTFCYHDVRDFAPLDKYTSHCVDMAQIVDDVERSTAAGLVIVGRGVDYLSLFKESLSTDQVLLTFDDGYSSQVRALYQLGRDMNVGALLFVIVGQVGKEGFADWCSLYDLAAAGYSIQSHGYSHIALTLLDYPALKDELKRAREELEDRISQPVWGLAVPQGFYNRRVLRAAYQTGYRILFTSRFGVGVRFHPAYGIVLVDRIVACGNRVGIAISALRRASVRGWGITLAGRCQDSCKNLLGPRAMRLLWNLLRSHR